MQIHLALLLTSPHKGSSSGDVGMCQKCVCFHRNRRVGSDWTRRARLRRMISGNGFTMKRTKAAFALMLLLQFAAIWKHLIPSYFFFSQSSWKETSSLRLQLLWCWVTQWLILEIIEINLFSPFFFSGYTVIFLIIFYPLSEAGCCDLYSMKKPSSCLGKVNPD